jgi:hypothetical protein
MSNENFPASVYFNFRRSFDFVYPGLVEMADILDTQQD